MKKTIIIIGVSSFFLLTISLLPPSLIACKGGKTTNSSSTLKAGTAGGKTELGKGWRKRIRKRGGRFQGKDGNKEAIETVELSSEAVKLLEIKVAKAEIRDISDVITAPGKIAADQNRIAVIGPIFEGRIYKIFVNPGDWVKKGAPLVILESPEVATAKSDFYKAYAAMELAKINYEREKRLFAEHITPKKRLLDAEAQYKIAQANLEAAEKTLHVMGFTEDDVALLKREHKVNPVITLRSPIPGKVVKRNAILGALVAEKDDLFTIMDTSEVWVDAQVYEKDLAQVKLGGRVEVTVTPYPDKVFRGKVIYISDLINNETRTATVRTVVKNQDGLLKVDMFATVRIITNEGVKGLAVPKSAIVDEKGRKFIFVKEKGHFRRVPVVLGQGNSKLVEIRRGLKEGDLVVVDGATQLEAELLKKKTKVEIHY